MDEIEEVDVEVFIPNSEARRLLGIKSAQYSIDLRILRDLRDRGEISGEFDSYPHDPSLSPKALEILIRYRQLVKEAGVRQAVNKIKEEYGNER